MARYSLVIVVDADVFMLREAALAIFVARLQAFLYRLFP